MLDSIFPSEIFNQNQMAHVFNSGISLIKQVSQSLNNNDQFTDVKLQVYKQMRSNYILKTYKSTYCTHADKLIQIHTHT